MAVGETTTSLKADTKRNNGASIRSWWRRVSGDDRFACTPATGVPRRLLQAKRGFSRYAAAGANADADRCEFLA
jgi:hypothetical protein